MHATLADLIADTAQNAIEAGASRVELTVSECGGRFSVVIADNGKGMDESVRRRVFDPFYTEAGKHDGRRVGLGLPILKQMCEACGGSLSLKSEKGAGTTLSYDFDAANIDLPPVGDLAKMLLTLMNYPGGFELVFTHRTDRGDYSITRSELSEAVGGLESVEGLSLVGEFLSGQETALKEAEA